MFQRGDGLDFVRAAQHAHVPDPVEQHRLQVLGAGRGCIASPRAACVSCCAAGRIDEERGKKISAVTAFFMEGFRSRIGGSATRHLPRSEVRRPGPAKRGVQRERNRFQSMPNLRHHVRVVVVAARRHFGEETCVLVRIETKRPRRHHPRLGEHVGILDRDLVDERIALAA